VIAGAYDFTDAACLLKCPLNVLCFLHCALYGLNRHGQSVHALNQKRAPNEDGAEAEMRKYYRERFEAQQRIAGKLASTIGEETARLIKGLWPVFDRWKASLKGIDEPLRVYSLRSTPP
jgi:hypothetical protein